METWRDCIFVTNERVEVRFRFQTVLNHAHKAIETTKSVELLSVTELRCVECVAQEAQ
jgi:hypothetical protein